MQKTITIDRSAVLAEVAQKSAYIGAKKQDSAGEQDETAYERISTVDEDEDELLPMWDECRGEVAEKFMSSLVSEGMDTSNTDQYDLVLTLRDNMVDSLVTSMQTDIYNFFVYGILSRWCLYTNKEEAEAYASMGEEYLNKAWRKSLKRIFKRGMRPF